MSIVEPEILNTLMYANAMWTCPDCKTENPHPMQICQKCGKWRS